MDGLAYDYIIYNPRDFSGVSSGYSAVNNHLHADKP